MKILHTSDWHIGHILFGKRRHEEHEAFLDWLCSLVSAEKIEVLLVAGDVFDTASPSVQAQELYYSFLTRMADSQCPCRHVVVTAGNHDSPKFLDAPAPLLRSLNVHVVGRGRDPRDEVIVLKDAAGRAGLIVCAVPFLRDRELYTLAMAESDSDLARKKQEGMGRHYAACARAAEDARMEAGGNVPVIAMGHLYASGARPSARSEAAPVGTLDGTDASVFPESLDYVALGHLHGAQIVNGNPKIRYSGSPLAMSFSEDVFSKQVMLLSTEGASVSCNPVSVPEFRKIRSIEGDMQAIEAGLQDAGKEAGERTAWLEVRYTGEEVVGDLRERVRKATPHNVEVLRTFTNSTGPARCAAAGDGTLPSLGEMTPEEVFKSCLDDNNVSEPQRGELMKTYREALEAIQSGTGAEE